VSSFQLPGARTLLLAGIWHPCSIPKLGQPRPPGRREWRLRWRCPAAARLAHHVAAALDRCAAVRLAGSLASAWPLCAFHIWCLPRLAIVCCRILLRRERWSQLWRHQASTTASLALPQPCRPVRTCPLVARCARLLGPLLISRSALRRPESRFDEPGGRAVGPWPAAVPADQQAPVANRCSPHCSRRLPHTPFCSVFVFNAAGQSRHPAWLLTGRHSRRPSAHGSEAISWNEAQPAAFRVQALSSPATINGTKKAVAGRVDP